MFFKEQDTMSYTVQLLLNYKKFYTCYVIFTSVENTVTVQTDDKMLGADQRVQLTVHVSCKLFTVQG